MTCFENQCLTFFYCIYYGSYLLPFEDKIVVSRMARKLNLQAVSSLFAVQFSERSGLVKDVNAAESILREYETATTTRFSCFKANKGFGNTGERFSIYKNWKSVRFVLNYFCSTKQWHRPLRGYTRLVL